MDKSVEKFVEKLRSRPVISTSLNDFRRSTATSINSSSVRMRIFGSDSGLSRR